MCTKSINVEKASPSQHPSTSWPKLKAPFYSSFEVCQMRVTEAFGVDGIPVSILDKGIEMNTGPVSHLVNRSLASTNCSD
ncbi:Hypothetical protein FKW44_015108 [Caligus rogercresseyi]|uniref:Uncharacterized protein n=1 Tax=Caligus rogercresseyi TaxID=217165 RepID=A0A7T8GZV0_CALRO|nr:Hypothetical protein FKW44_015108 [Caligus rogercresseyi]